MTEENTTSTMDVQPDDATGGGEQPEKKFSQEELDHILSDRLKREREKYADYADLKEKAAKLDEIEEANKTELEKAQELATRAQAERDEALAQADERLIRAAFVAEAAQLNVAHPGDAYMLADLTGVEIAEDGNVTGVKEAVEALVKSGRLVIRQGAAPDLDGGAGSGKAGSDVVTLSEEQLRVAQKMNISPEEYAKGLRYKRKE